MKCIILSANAYSMRDEVSGQINSGVSIYYLPTNSLLPVVDGNGLLGVVPCKDNVDLSMSGEFTQVPGIYDVEMGVKAIKGRAMMKIVSAKFVGTIITAEDKANLEAKTAEDKANLEAKTAEDKANLESKTAEDKANLEAKTAEDKANMEAKTAEDKAHTEAKTK